MLSRITCNSSMKELKGHLVIISSLLWGNCVGAAGSGTRAALHATCPRPDNYQVRYINVVVFGIT